MNIIIFKEKKYMTTEGFEPSPFRNSALNYRLRPLGQIVIAVFISILLEFISQNLIFYNNYLNVFIIINI